jgi:hypothetical protein
MKVAVMTSLSAKGNMEVNPGHAANLGILVRLASPEGMKGDRAKSQIPLRFVMPFEGRPF